MTVIHLLIVFIATLCVCFSTAQKTVCTKEAVADIVFLVDGSWSIGTGNFQQMQDFLRTLVDSFNIGPDEVRIALVLYSTTPHTEFYLKTFRTKQDVLQHIGNLTYKGGSTMTGLGLDFILKEHFVAHAGSRARDGVPQIAVVITDGQSQDSVEPYAQELRDRGIILYAIGIKEADEKQLRKIGSEPHDRHVYIVSDFSALQGISLNIIQGLCSNVEEAKRPTSEETQECTVSIAIGFDITRRTNKPSLFSAQEKLQTLLPEMIQHFTSLDSLCCAPRNRTKAHIDIWLVDEQGRLLDSFSFDQYNEDLVKKVLALQTDEDSYLNTQLLASFREMLKTAPAAVKVLILFTDGLDESVEKLEMESDSLRNSGVSALVTVALENVQNVNDLQMIEFGRGFGYRQPMTLRMENVAHVLLNQIDAVAHRECCGVMCKCFGFEGAQGPTGLQGTKGSQGKQGFLGYPGDEGAHGDRGLLGLNGIQGLQGCPGITGPKGMRGYSGNNGDRGDDGFDGVSGEQGDSGLNGTRGEKGDQGGPGQQGNRGGPGMVGQTGFRGDPGDHGNDSTVEGLKGEMGRQGTQGDVGEDGHLGSPGDEGNPGAQGRHGPTGAKGLSGDRGDLGIQGHPGPPGPLGARGGMGAPGPQGSLGFPGLQGQPGPTGPKGSRGKAGMKGIKGQQGDPGPKGGPGSLGARGMPGLDGKDGYGLSGPKGLQGQIGLPGYPGLQGEIGSKGQRGDPGPKGSRGRGGAYGLAGDIGDPGEMGRDGHRGARGVPGYRTTNCQIISYIQNNCACCMEHSKCPAYPTELVLALDTSQDVTPQVFERMRSRVVDLLEDISIAESNCPTGARVAVVSYSSSTKYLIRFSDYHQKKHLLEAVNNLSLERSSSPRNIGAAMRFVARNVFKHTRQALLMRKVAIFFANGPSQDATSINTAVLEFKALDIHPAVIGFRNTPNVQKAFETDETRSFIVTLLEDGQEQKAQLRTIQQCLICYDPCSPAPECLGISTEPVPLQLDLDLAVLVDGSHNMQADQYDRMKEFWGSVLDQVAVSSQPNRSDGQARVAVYQQVFSDKRENPVVKEFDFVTYQNIGQMKNHIHAMHQAGGASALGHAVEWVVMNGFLKAPMPRTNRMLLVSVGGQTAQLDQAKLTFISQKAKCQGIVLFMALSGDYFNTTQAEALASFPVEQHVVHVGEMRQAEQEYGQRFLTAFLSMLKKGLNDYQSAPLGRTCENLRNQDTIDVLEVADGPARASRVPIPAHMEHVEEDQKWHSQMQITSSQRSSGAARVAKGRKKARGTPLSPAVNTRSRKRPRQITKTAV